MLKTDRVPDSEFARCLDGQRVDYRRLNSGTKKTVDGQLASEETAAAFFEAFEFVHSQQQYDDYEESLRAQLDHDTDKNGWAYFRQEVRRWAMRKNAPRPDGKIRHFHLLGVFARDRPVVATPRLRRAGLATESPTMPSIASSSAKPRAADGVAVLWGPARTGKEHVPEPLRVGAGSAGRCRVHSAPLLSQARRTGGRAVQLLRD